MVEILQYLERGGSEIVRRLTMGRWAITGSRLLLLSAVVRDFSPSIAVIKLLNLLLLGENYARTMGSSTSSAHAR